MQFKSDASIDLTRRYANTNLIAYNIGSGILSRHSNYLAFNDRRNTLWGRITGKNKTNKLRDKYEHEEKMAKILSEKNKNKNK